jgi:hypothetical protein
MKEEIDVANMLAKESPGLSNLLGWHVCRQDRFWKEDEESSCRHHEFKCIASGRVR